MILNNDRQAIQAAKEAGAAINEDIVFVLFGPHHYPWSRPITLLERRPGVLWVNKNGERFADESTFFSVAAMASVALSKQPGSICYTIVDSKNLERILNSKPVSGLEEVLGDNGAWLINLKHNLETEAQGLATVAQVKSDLCNGCGICEDTCALDAITIIDGQLFIAEDLCEGCGGCVMNCPEKAIKLKNLNLIREYATS